MSRKKIKYALVLSGGGFNGAFQLGALNYINDNWKELTGLSGRMKFDLIAGVSVGAINGAMVASKKLGLLNELWLNKIAKNGVGEIYTSDFIDTKYKGDDLKLKLDLESIRTRLLPNFELNINWLDKLKMVFSKRKRKELFKRIIGEISEEIKKNFSSFKAIGDNSPLKLKLSKYLDKDKIDDTEFLCGFVSLDNGKYHSVSHSDFLTNDDFVNGVLSSASIPMVYDPIKSVGFRNKKELQYSHNNIDGGVNNVSPLGDVIKKIIEDSGFEYKVIIINCHSGVNISEDFTMKNIGQIASRSLYDIAFTEIFNNDVKHFVKINDLVKQAEKQCTDLVLFENGVTAIKAFDAVIIQPHKEFDLGNGLVANEKLINLRLNHGELMAKRAFKKGGK